jgi:hypothetical protein
MMSKCANIAKSHLLGFIVLSSQVRQRRSTFFFFFFFFFYEESWNSIPRTQIQTARHEGICGVMINSHIGSTKQAHNLLGCSKAHRSACAIAVERKWLQEDFARRFDLIPTSSRLVWIRTINRRGLLWLVRFAKICVLWQTLPNF